MIRINLLAVEREQTRKRSAFGATQKLTIGCSVILIVAGLFIFWRYWSLARDSKRVDDEIAAAQQESGRLHDIILQVQQFEQRKAQLTQRVTLIEQLRKGQTGPVHMLDEISKALPTMLWLTELKQTSPGEVTIDGRCTTLTSLSDFVANLESSSYFKRPIDIVSSQSEPMTGAPGELIKFTLKATFQGAPDAPLAPGGRIPGGSAIPTGPGGKKGG